LYEAKKNVHLFERKGEKGLCMCGGKEENCPPIPKEKEVEGKNKTTQFHPCCKGEMTKLFTHSKVEDVLQSCK